MSEINYEVEVKRFSSHVWAEKYDHFIDANSGWETLYWIIQAGIGAISGQFHTESEAWKNAYEKIKSQIK